MIDKQVLLFILLNYKFVSCYNSCGFVQFDFFNDKHRPG